VNGAADAWNDPVVVEVVRGGFVESVHRGRVVGLDATGTTVLDVGDTSAPVLLRSCAKPLQAVGMLRSGLDLDGAELAVVCASHSGTERHLDLVRAVLDGAGLDETTLDNTPALALDPVVASSQLLGKGPDRMHQNCSGKHAGMLATCVVNGWPTTGYLDPAHPLQVALLAAVAEQCGEAPAHTAVDGCGAPIVAVSLRGLATAFRRLALAGDASAEGRVAAAMRAHPAVVGGDGRDVTRLASAVAGLVAKDGAEGCFAAALADGRAVAVKIDDGTGRAWPPVAVAALTRLGEGGNDPAAMARLAAPPVFGHGVEVGAIRPAGPLAG
jgi:L-asparaginase II